MESIQWFPGHMAKGKRLIEKYKSLIDLFVIIVDARVPFSSIHNSFTEGLIDKNKSFLVFSKTDLADDSQTKKWIDYYNKKFNKVIECNLTDNNATTKNLGKEIDLYFKKNNIKRKQIMVLGVPNVGKSTMINSLAGRKVAKTGNKPSITRGVTWISTKSGFRIFDTPGILEPKIDSNRSAYNLAIVNSIKNDILNRDDIVEHLLTFLGNNYPKETLEFISETDDSILDDYIKIEESIMKKKNFVLKNNEPDYERLFIYILKSVSTGKFGKITFDNYEQFRKRPLNKK